MKQDRFGLLHPPYLQFYFLFQVNARLRLFFSDRFAFLAFWLIRIVFFRGHCSICVAFTFKAILALGNFLLIHRGHNLSKIVAISADDRSAKTQ